MKYIKNMSLVAVLSFVGFVNVSQLASAESPVAKQLVVKKALTPVEVVDTSLEEIQQQIEEKADQIAKDASIPGKIVEDELMPYINTRTIARRVMGKYYKKATIEQKKLFVTKFKNSLINVYSKGLLNVGKVAYKVEEIKNDGKRSKVLLKATLPSGTEIPVVFHFKYNQKKSRWFGENLEVAGLNLGSAYRDKFAEEMSKNGNDIDKVIANWSSDITE